MALFAGEEEPCKRKLSFHPFSGHHMGRNALRGRRARIDLFRTETEINEIAKVLENG